ASRASAQIKKSPRPRPPTATTGTTAAPTTPTPRSPFGTSHLGGVGADAVAPSEPTEQFGLLRGELLIGDDAALMQPGQRLDGRDDGRGVPGRAGSRLGCLRLRCELRCRL